MISLEKNKKLEPNPNILKLEGLIPGIIQSSKLYMDLSKS